MWRCEPAASGSVPSPQDLAPGGEDAQFGVAHQLGSVRGTSNWWALHSAANSALGPSRVDHSATYSIDKEAPLDGKSTAQFTTTGNLGRTGGPACYGCIFLVTFPRHPVS